MQYRGLPALLISVVVHGSLLGAAAAVKLVVERQQQVAAVETIFEDERTQEEFVRDVDLDTTASRTLSLTSGGGGGRGGGGSSGTGAGSGVAGDALAIAAGAPIAQQRVTQSQRLQDPRVRVTSIGDFNLPGVASLSTDLGEGEVSGEVGARSDGYGSAMHRLTQEIIRMMREKSVTAVWLFDRSSSMQDDRAEIRNNFAKIHDELSLVQEQSGRRDARHNPLETMICSFGSDLRKLTPHPLVDINEVKQAIDQIREDTSGQENVFAAIGAILEEFGAATQRHRRKLAIILVTDESGDDEQYLEDVVAAARRYDAPVYVLGREAIFGYKTARVLWIDEKTKLPFWPVITRGPETAEPECLQYDGFHNRSWEATSSGFGPYAQVRLVKESGGIFFLLSGDEDRLVGRGARTPRKFDDIAMKEYEPQLAERREYVRLRDASPFRKTVHEVIQTLDPERDALLNLRRDAYPVTPDEFRREGRTQFERALRCMGLLQEAVARLERVRPGREQESSQRWRADYDLVYAQCLSYRVRQFQFLLALDKHERENPPRSNPKTNQWDVRHVRELLQPSEQQVQATKVDLAALEAERENATTWYRYVIEQHPNTPWAVRARIEMNWGFGITFVEDFRDPRYDSDDDLKKRVPKF